MMVIEIADDLAFALRVPPEERLPRLQRELALRLYQKGLLSFGKARELAGMEKWEFTECLAAEGIFRNYDVAEFEQDLQTLEQLN